MSAGEVALGAVKNFPQSALNFGESVIHPFLHPGDTIKNLWTLQRGLMDAVGMPTPKAGLGFFGPDMPTSDDEKATLGKVKDFYVGRYGSVEGVKKAIAEDPVGVLSDASAVLTLGGAGAAQAPGKLGQVGGIVRDVGSATNPINVVAELAKAGGRVAAHGIGAFGTHTGAQPLREAFDAGAQGGGRAQAFTDSMRGITPAQQVVDEAKNALLQMRADRGAQYRAGMAGVKADATVLDFQKVLDAVDDVGRIGTYKGKVLNQPAADTWAQIKTVVDDWAKSPASDFHTAEGLDALKQAIGNIRQSTQYGTPGRVVADGVYNAVKAQIVKQAPKYADVMKGYEHASDLITDIEKTLSLGEKASVDTALRKLQSVMRNNVNTTYGRRVDLATELSNKGAPNLMPMIAGQSLNSWTPRGLGSLQAGGTGALAWAMADPTLLALLPFQSPRLMGEAAHLMGQGSRFLPQTSPFLNPAQTGFQLGREPYR